MIGNVQRIELEDGAVLLTWLQNGKKCQQRFGKSFQVECEIMWNHLKKCENK